MGRIRLSWALVIAAGSALMAPAVQAAGFPARFNEPIAGAAVAADWSAKVWDAAVRGDRATLDDLLAHRPAAADPDGRLGKSIELFDANIKAREEKRAQELTKVSQELDKALAEGNGDLAISQALRAAVALNMISEAKEALMEEPRIKGLVTAADAAARAAEARGDWLTASELYYRLSLLLEESGTYKDDVKRETQRLAMIRLYAPQRMWELRNDRRNAEIEWSAKHGDVESDDLPPAGSDPVDSKDPAAKKATLKPLPPYNATGDDYRKKLEGIEDSMVISAVGRAYGKHVERTPMDKILRSGIDALRTMVTTEDLKSVFTGIADPEARAAFIAALAAEDERLARQTATLGTSDLMSLLPRLIRTNEQTVKLPRAALLHEFGNGAMAALDEFSAIIWPDEIRRFNRNTQAKFKGVGIQIELDPMSNIRVVTPLEGTPAQRAGIRPGDLIKKVDGSSTEGFSLEQAVDVITGPGDTRVTLTIEREAPGAVGDASRVEIDFPLIRAEIPVYTVKGWKKSGVKEDDWDWFVDPDHKIGYVRLTQFADRTDREFDRAIDQMKDAGLSGLILDLRHNPGGLLDQAVAITSRFVGRAAAQHHAGMVVTTHTKDNTLVQQERLMPGVAKLAGIPTVVLINEGSASASEIVSGALQDYASTGEIKALLLGWRSYGKGSVQNVWQLPGAIDAAIKVTTQYYHLPAGRMIHRLPGAPQWGVEPNLKVEMLPKQIVDSLVLRQNADVLRLDENGKAAAKPGDKTPDPNDLINKGMDLQLQQALVLLETQTPATNPALVERPAKN